MHVNTWSQATIPPQHCNYTRYGLERRLLYHEKRYKESARLYPRLTVSSYITSLDWLLDIVELIRSIPTIDLEWIITDVLTTYLKVSVMIHIVNHLVAIE